MLGLRQHRSEAESNVEGSKIKAKICGLGMMLQEGNMTNLGQSTMFMCLILKICILSFLFALLLCFKCVFPYL